MTIKAEILKDSINPDGKRLTTFHLYYPKFILAELNTHRQFSRNTASSRAIPIGKMAKFVREDLVLPLDPRKNCPGMSSQMKLPEDIVEEGERLIKEHFEASAKLVEKLNILGYHKQTANRYLEPFMHVSTVLTSTEWENFYSLRISPQAQPEICKLATLMKELQDNNTPTPLGWGDVHVPFCDRSPDDIYTNDLMVSVAKCARISYNNHLNDSKTYEQDLELYSKLRDSGHLSPFEHVAIADKKTNLSGNFRGGWLQYRQQV